MKVINTKNLAFADQPAPIPLANMGQFIKDRQALKPMNTASVTLGLNIPVAEKADLDVVALDRKIPGQLSINVKNFKVGQHFFPPDIPVKQVESLGDKGPKLPKALLSDGLLPDHLALQLGVNDVRRESPTPPWQLAFPSESRKRGNQATTVFPPDNRVVFNNTSYPWSCCGRVDSPIGSGSGVMIGPRHMLTVSHVIQWGANNSAGWVKFSPMYFNGSTPFGVAWGTLIYSKYKVSGPTIDFIEAQYDYVVVVLDHPIGNLTGWMGAKGYTDSWDGGNYWTHVGYPADLTGANRPTWQGSISLDGAWYEFDSHEAMSHTADVWPGQSGGPFFGWWSGQSYPSVVAVQSSQSSGENDASGGQDMVDLILRARSEHP
jgi:V8-like Glu-specific endopeptidase